MPILLTTIPVRAILAGCDTNDQGAALQALMAQGLAAGKIVTVDFAGVPNVTSSFVNTAFVDLLDDVPYVTFKARLRIVHANRQICTIIKDLVSKKAGVTDRRGL